MHGVHGAHMKPPMMPMPAPAPAKPAPHQQEFSLAKLGLWQGEEQENQNTPGAVAKKYPSLTDRQNSGKRGQADKNASAALMQDHPAEAVEADPSATADHHLVSVWI